MKLKSNIVYLLFLLNALTIIAQKEVLTIPMGYKSIYYSDKESLAISNPKTGDLVIFVEDTENTKAVLLDKDFNIKNQLFIESLERTFKTFLGYQINLNGSYSIFFTNNSKKKYGILNLDFDKSLASQKKLDFKFKKEVFIEGISFKDKFYLMSVSKNSSNVHFYMFNEIGFVLDKKTVKFDFLNYISPDGYNRKASNYLISSNFISNSGLVKMDANSPNAIEVTSKANKLYIINDSFVFTFDNHNKKTQIATVSPSNNFNISTKEINKPTIVTNGFTMNHNSYLYNDKIFQVASTSKILHFSIKDYSSGDILKELTVKKEDSITFKNTPIIQDGPGFIAGNRTRKMEETSKFLRKVSRGDIGIGVYKHNNKYKITIGSKIEIKRGGGFGAMGGFGGFPMASFGAVSVTFNPTFFAYGNYSSTKSTYIDCVFDQDFNHLEGEVPINSFDRIKKFENKFIKKNSREVKQERLTNSDFSDYGSGIESNFESDKNKPELKNVFYHNNRLYFGYIGSQDRNYHLIEFNN